MPVSSRRRSYRRNLPVRSVKLRRANCRRLDLKNAFALFVLTQTGKSDDFRNESQELYLHRNEGTDEDRALLAIALHQQNIMAREQQQLLREIDKPIKERAFNPATFTSMTRAEAMRAFAFNLISPPTWTKQRRQQARDRISKLMGDAGSLSTQENLWLLLAFKSMLGAETTPNCARRNRRLMCFQKMAGLRRGSTARLKTTSLLKA